MSKIFFFFCIGLGFFASAQEKKKDSVNSDLKDYVFKPRVYYPSDSSCPGKVIYKELKKGDTDFNPYNYKEIKVIKIEDFNEEEKKTLFDFIKKA